MESPKAAPVMESLKRPHPDEEISDNRTNLIPSIEVQDNNTEAPGSPLSMDASGSTHPCVVLPNGVSRQQSPALSSISTLTSVSATPPPMSTIPPNGSGTTIQAPPAKRRKLTFAEKEQRRVEREVKEQQRAIEKARKEEEKVRKEEEKNAEKAKKDEEKLVKDEERRQKNEEKEEKRREKELEKQQKEEEKKRKEEEIAKKERAQKRMTSFFIKPSTPTKNASVTSSYQEAKDVEQLKSISTPQKDNVAPHIAPLPLNREAKSDYEKSFLSFSLPTNAIMAPHNRFSWDERAISYMEKNVFISSLKDETIPRSHQLRNMLDLPPQLSDPVSKHVSVKELMNVIEGSPSHPVDLTPENSNGRRPLHQLRQVPVKYIYFQTDVRPPYVGTNTRITNQKKASRIMRNPFRQAHPELEYDYDSEAEWEEPEEGEELLSEAESDTESQAGDDMDDFLDDEDAAEAQKLKKGKISADQQPKSSGLCWENETGINNVSSGPLSNFKSLKMELLLESAKWPIDPFSTSYWEDSSKATNSNSVDSSRQPLQIKPNIFLTGQSTSMAPKTSSTNPHSSKSKPSKSPCAVLVGQELSDFKEAVDGSELPKVGLLAVLKKRFPKVKNDTLKETLGQVAARVGAREAEKRWRIVEQPAATMVGTGDNK